MEKFKPFVNLTKSKSTGKYTLNSVISVPKSYAIRNISQFEIEEDGKKKWAVKADIVPGDSKEQDIIEFSVPLEQGPTESIRKTSMIVSMACEAEGPADDKSTELNYDDAETTEP
jgi:hypothetical protein